MKSSLSSRVSLVRTVTCPLPRLGYGILTPGFVLQQGRHVTRRDEGHPKRSTLTISLDFRLPGFGGTWIAPPALAHAIRGPAVSRSMGTVNSHRSSAVLTARIG